MGSTGNIGWQKGTVVKIAEYKAPGRISCVLSGLVCFVFMAFVEDRNKIYGLT